jgi:hypothetical protein
MGLGQSAKFRAASLTTAITNSLKAARLAPSPWRWPGVGAHASFEPALADLQISSVESGECYCVCAGRHGRRLGFSARDV